jgi:hypothetical protein
MTARTNILAVGLVLAACAAPARAGDWGFSFSYGNYGGCYAPVYYDYPVYVPAPVVYDYGPRYYAPVVVRDYAPEVVVYRDYPRCYSSVRAYGYPRYSGRAYYAPRRAYGGGYYYRGR